MLLPCGFWYARDVWLTGNPLYPMQISVFGQCQSRLDGSQSAMVATAYHLPPAAWRLLVIALVLVSRPRWARPGRCRRHLGWSMRSSRTRDLAARTVLALCSTLALAQARSIGSFSRPTPRNGFCRRRLGWRWCRSRSGGAAAKSETPRLRQVQHRQAVLFALAGWQVSDASHSPFCSRFDRRGRGGTEMDATCTVVYCRRVIVVGCCFSVWPSLRALDEQPLLRFYPRDGFAARLLPGWEILERSVRPRAPGSLTREPTCPTISLGSACGTRSSTSTSTIIRTGCRTTIIARGCEGQTGLARDPWPQWYRSNADYEAWLANLRRRRIDFVFIARENRHGRLEVIRARCRRFPSSEAWADAHPESFVDLGPFEYPQTRFRGFVSTG